MTTSEDTTKLELHVDEMAARFTCKNCGTVLLGDHGIIRSSDSGVTWWQCPNPDCGHRFKEEYVFEWNPDRKITVSMEDITK